LNHPTMQRRAGQSPSELAGSGRWPRCGGDRGLLRAAAASCCVSRPDRGRTRSRARTCAVGAARIPGGWRNGSPPCPGPGWCG